MRFNQVKKESNVVMRKKMYKKGKNWIVASTLAFAGVAMMGTTTINAATTTSNAKEQAAIQLEKAKNSKSLKENDPSEKDGSVQTNAENPGLPDGYVQTEVTVQTNLKDENQQPMITTVTAVGKPNSTVQAQTHSIGKLEADKPFVTVIIDKDGHGTTTDTLVYTQSGTGSSTGENPDTQTPLEKPDFPLPDGLGLSDVLTYGKDGTANYVISKNGVLYFLKGNFSQRLSLEDTKEIGKKYGYMIRTIDTTANAQTNDIQAPRDSTGLFADNFKAVKNLKLDNLWFDEVENMDSMFANMPSLEKASFFYISTSKNVTNMHGLFSNDNKLSELSLKRLSTGKVTDMSEMFKGASSLKKLNLEKWDMKSVTKTDDIFAGTNLQYIRLGSGNKFSKTDTLPNKDGKDWVSLISKDDKSFSSTDKNGNSLAKYYDGSGQIGAITFGLKPSKEQVVDPANPVKPELPNDKGNKVYEVTIKSNLGDQHVGNIKGKAGDEVDVKIPEIKGYTADKKTVKVVLHKNGKATTDEKIEYTGNNIKADLFVKTNLDKKDKPTIIKDVKGKVGYTIDIKTPVVKGYTADKETVKAKVNPDGTITTKDTITYKKEDAKISHFNRNIQTFANGKTVMIYKLDGSTISAVNGRQLGADSSWYSDQEVIIDGVLYFRVATNEWVKASDVYQYRVTDSVIRTKNDARLVNAQGRVVTDRIISGETDWYTDKAVIIGDGAYYRVATNEFISTVDVY